MPTEEEVFEFLVNLRDSGVTNMYGAGPYVRSNFALTSKEANKWLAKWMRSFDK